VLACVAGALLLMPWCCYCCLAGYFKDNIVTHLVAGLGAGFFAVCVGSPVDVVKSRVMGEPSCSSLQQKSHGLMLYGRRHSRYSRRVQQHFR
jgi:hypothetical protein